MVSLQVYNKVLKNQLISLLIVYDLLMVQVAEQELTIKLCLPTQRDNRLNHTKLKNIPVFITISSVVIRFGFSVCNLVNNY
jgi:hypothetical protein